MQTLTDHTHFCKKVKKIDTLHKDNCQNFNKILEMNKILFLIAKWWCFFFQEKRNGTSGFSLSSVAFLYKKKIEQIDF